MIASGRPSLSLKKAIHFLGAIRVAVDQVWGADELGPPLRISTWAAANVRDAKIEKACPRPRPALCAQHQPRPTAVEKRPACRR